MKTAWPYFSTTSCDTRPSFLLSIWSSCWSDYCFRNLQTKRKGITIHPLRIERARPRGGAGNVGTGQILSGLGQVWMCELWLFDNAQWEIQAFFGSLQNSDFIQMLGRPVDFEISKLVNISAPKLFMSQKVGILPTVQCPRQNVKDERSSSFPAGLLFKTDARPCYKYLRISRVLNFSAAFCPFFALSSFRILQTPW